MTMGRMAGLRSPHQHQLALLLLTVFCAFGSANSICKGAEDSAALLGTGRNQDALTENHRSAATYGFKEAVVEDGARRPQVCICSPITKRPGTEAPDCQCTDLSILDHLLGPELLRDASKKPMPGAHPQADSSDSSLGEPKENASEGLEDETSGPAARSLGYRSTRAVLYEQMSQEAGANMGAAPDIEADEESSADSSSPSETCSNRLALARREEEKYDQVAGLVSARVFCLRMLCRDSVRHLKETPWAVPVLTALMTLCITWCARRLLGRVGVCQRADSSGKCSECQSRQATMEAYARRRLDRQYSVAPRPAASDVLPRIPFFDSDDEENDPPYKPDLSQKSSSDWESDSSSGDSCEML